MQALAERLGDALTGKVLEGVEPLGFSALKMVVPAPETLIGRPVERVDRRAKYVILDFGESGRILLHLSQAGRLDLENPPKKTRAKGSVVRLRFSCASTGTSARRRGGCWRRATTGRSSDSDPNPTPTTSPRSSSTVSTV